MRIAMVENGIVMNVCEADADWVAAHGGIETNIAGTGWLYDGVNFSAPVPTAEELAAQTERAATLNALAAAKADAAIQYLITHTPAECAAYVQANVTNLATAVNFLGRVAMVLSIIAKDRLK